MSEDIKVGDRVVYRGTDTAEYGIVVQTYRDQGDLDCYVAFWGNEVPTMDEAQAPETRPYILRYYAASLDRVEAAPAAEE